VGGIADVFPIWLSSWSCSIVPHAWRLTASTHGNCAKNWKMMSSVTVVEKGRVSVSRWFRVLIRFSRHTCAGQWRGTHALG